MVTGGRGTFDGGSDEDREEVTFGGTLPWSSVCPSQGQDGQCEAGRQNRAGESASRPVWGRRLREGEAGGGRQGELHRAFCGRQADFACNLEENREPQWASEHGTHVI